MKNGLSIILCLPKLLAHCNTSNLTQHWLLCRDRAWRPLSNICIFYCRKELEEDCKAKLHSLYHIVEETWSSFIPIRKGRSLILRTLAVVDKPSSRSLFDRLLSSLGPFIKKELTDPVSVTYLVKRLLSVLFSFWLHVGLVIGELSLSYVSDVPLQYYLLLVSCYYSNCF